MINSQGIWTNYRLWQRRCLYPFISVSVALTVCLSTQLSSKAIGFSDLIRIVPQVTQIFNLSNISDRQEVDLGQQINQEIQQEVRISRNSQLNSYVEQIGRRLAANSTRPNIPYTFQVVEDPAVNAFATAGGFIYVNTGLLKTADNEAEFASVLAHEMGHIEGKHLIKQMRQQAIASGVATVSGLDKSKAVGIGVQLALNLPRSRQDEFDADKRGLANITRTGYAQSAMVSFMKKLQRSSSVPTFLSTHPGASDRVISLQNQIKNQPSSQNHGLDNPVYQSKMRAFLP
ncbi:M48 family metallopeptidase [Dolichospermum sp. UHCC 0684]|jgi:beta-barrel assembly-enhancing protease|uniref:M48 family metallopeptidase n=1 Tax=Nostocales TaxID=1161 RepID=UPI00029B5B58|nr:MULTISPECIES: M48 family metallopeptidase [Nostocales]MBO1046590.1 M48 family metalloprotease [Dolichospermum sp. DEX182a]MBS9394984.1 M48 family metalloprotease [Dolichospermum sp. OL01]MCO5798611.1 M48 family metalloprotease [Dolichospermum sp. OL03]MCS6283443.1 M48 family metalloprotease [Dolichospermum sp.]OBQ41333.1 MAG: peptidase [Anabaena sp. MDT14b]QSV60042.1 MAG: M48 family metalloprotease [Dolichospermum sp. LBC05a]QSV62183.1 MAG: M48 family metalloprotease [Dolichospermum sp. D